MADTIDFNALTDVPADIITDVIPEKIIKVYPYELSHANAKRPFIKQNATSIALITQDTLADEPTDPDYKTQLQQDDQGNWYFEMLAAVTSNGVLDISTSTSSIGQIFREEDQFSGISNYFYEKIYDDLNTPTIAGQKFLPVILTVGEPFDKTKYENDELAVFIATNISEAKKGLGAVYDTFDKEGLYQFDLINISSIASSFQDVSIQFYQGNISNLQNFQLSVKMDPGTWLGGIQGKGIPKSSATTELVDLDFKPTGGLVQIKGTPISVQNKLTMYSDWFDYDVVMPQYIANTFQNLNGVKLSALKNVDFLKSGTTSKFFDDAQYNLLQDTILFSALFATSFSEPTYRYTAQEAKDAGGGAKAGDIKGNLTIGSQGQSMAAIAGKDPIKVIDGLFETYLRLHPGNEDSAQYKAIKEIFAAVSRYVYSSYSIGKGQNAFNQIYLPWYLKPTNGIQVKPITNNNVRLSDETKWRLESEWFDFSNRQFEVKTDVSLSKVRMIQTDRKLTIPQVPETLNEINKLPLPGDINTKTSQDLNYFWWLPVNDNSEISKIYLGTPNVTTGGQAVLRFSTEYTRVGETIANPEQYIKQQAARKYGVNASDVTIIDRGALDHRQERVNTSGRAGSQAALYRGEDSIIRKPRGVAGSRWTRQYAETEFFSKIAQIESRARGYNIEPRNLEIVDIRGGEFWHYYNDGFRFTDGSVYHIGNFSRIPNSSVRNVSGKSNNFLLMNSFGIIVKSERYINVDVTINKPSRAYDIDRKVVFDKAEWRTFMGNINTITGWIPLTETNNINIDTINELIFSMVWCDKFGVKINNAEFSIESFNKYDEKNSVHRVIFT